jgi:hypothetical protein
VVDGAQIGGYFARPFQVVGAGQSDGKGVEFRQVAPHERCDQTGVETAAQEDANRHVRHQALPYGGVHGGQEGVRPGFGIPRLVVGAPPGGHAPHGRDAVCAGVDVAGRKDLDRIRWHHRQQRLDLAGEDQAASVPAPIQGLDPQGVTAQAQALPVAARQGEHAMQQADRRRRAAFLGGMQPGFAITVRPGLMVSAQAGQDGPVVVDLAVMDQAQVPVLVEERLPATGDIDDAEAAMAEADLAEVVPPFAIGAAVGDRGQASRQRRRMPSLRVPGSDEAAHQRRPVTLPSSSTASRP